MTDHHAIIPTGIPAQNLTDLEHHVYDLVARRFISVFYPDCKFSTTTVTGKVDDIEFKVSGKQILDPGWRILYAKDMPSADNESPKQQDEERTLPSFAKGESGPHTPTLTEKWTTPPNTIPKQRCCAQWRRPASLLKTKSLRAVLKENGIGRPSSRANIIETLFKRRYIKRERKNIVATPTGIELIGTIKEELLKSLRTHRHLGEKTARHRASEI